MDSPVENSRGAAQPADSPSTVAVPPLAPKPVRVAAAIGFAVLVLALFQIGQQWALAHLPDFAYFYRGGMWLGQHGVFDPGYDVTAAGERIARGTIEWYLPFVHRFMTMWTWIPDFTVLGHTVAGQSVSGIVWLLFNLTVFVCTIRLIGRYFVGLPRQDWIVTQLIPILITILFWHWEFRLNQINNLTLLLLVGSFVCWRRGHSTAAGLWVGFATLLKVTPGLLIVWFLLKRQYRVVVFAGLTVLLAGPVADLVAFRDAEYVADRYRAWVAAVVGKTSHRALIMNDYEMDWRNQSVSATANRLLHHTNYSTHFDNDPSITFGDHEPPRFINIVNLPSEWVVRIVMGILVASLLGLLWLGRKPAADMSEWHLRFEWALFVLAMLWFTPIMRRYHMIWALPTVSLLFAGIHYSGHRGRWVWTATTALLLLTAGQLSLLSKWLGGTQIMEAFGVFTWTVLILAIPMVWMSLRLSANENALPMDYNLKVQPAPEPPYPEAAVAAS
ncbi:MAG: DUF2029 domain-containing protein [Phycisphaerales bacterium]|nr:DUF2029 domain-containing protein [Phycisphaerales bacterium]